MSLFCRSEGLYDKESSSSSSSRRSSIEASLTADDKRLADLNPTEKNWRKNVIKATTRGQKAILEVIVYFVF